MTISLSALKTAWHNATASGYEQDPRFRLTPDEMGALTKMVQSVDISEPGAHQFLHGVREYAQAVWSNNSSSSRTKTRKSATPTVTAVTRALRDPDTSAHTKSAAAEISQTMTPPSKTGAKNTRPYGRTASATVCVGSTCQGGVGCSRDTLSTFRFRARSIPCPVETFLTMTRRLLSVRLPPAARRAVTTLAA